MKKSNRKITMATVIAIGLIVPALWYSTKPVTAQEESPVQAQPGQRAFIDPATGGFIEQPKTAPSTSERAAEAAALDTSDEGLVETSSTVEGGGMVVDLQGRFRSPVTAKVDESGKTVISHDPIHSPTAKNITE